MTDFLDGHTLGVRCPSCDHKNSQTIGWLKTHKAMTCPKCWTTINLGSAEFMGEIRRVEKMLDDFARGIGKL
jgi:ribosomal protein S27E